MRRRIEPRVGSNAEQTNRRKSRIDQPQTWSDRAMATVNPVRQRGDDRPTAVVYAKVAKMFGDFVAASRRVCSGTRRQGRQPDRPFGLRRVDIAPVHQCAGMNSKGVRHVRRRAIVVGQEAGMTCTVARVWFSRFSRTSRISSARWRRGSSQRWRASRCCAETR